MTKRQKVLILVGRDAGHNYQLMTNLTKIWQTMKGLKTVISLKKRDFFKKKVVQCVWCNIEVRRSNSAYSGAAIIGNTW